MGKVTILLLLASAAVVVATFVNGLHAIHDASGALRHSRWALAALLAVLAANFFAIFHAAQSDRLIRALRDALFAERARRDTGPLDGRDAPPVSPP
jgi:hypothetical protein